MYTYIYIKIEVSILGDILYVVW